MAKFSQEFLRQMANPAMAQGLFTTAKQAAQLPVQLQQQKLQQQQRQQLAQIDTNSPQGLLQLAQFYRQQGDIENAVKYEEAARQLQAQGTLNAADERQLSKNFTLSSIQKYKETGSIKDLVRLTEQEDRFKVVGNNIFDTKTQRYIQPSEAVDHLTSSQLKDVVTNESYVKYLQTGDRDVLVAKGEKEEEGKKKLTPAEISSRLSKADGVIGVVAKAREADVWGGTFDIAKFLPLTEARSLSGYIKTLKGNLAFDELKQMREESKTGGALGQVSNIELGLLESAVANLDPATPETFYENLESVEEKYTNFKNALLGKPPVGKQWQQIDGVIYYKEDIDDNTSWVVITGE